MFLIVQTGRLRPREGRDLAQASWQTRTVIVCWPSSASLLLPFVQISVLLLSTRGQGRSAACPLGLTGNARDAPAVRPWLEKTWDPVLGEGGTFPSLGFLMVSREEQAGQGGGG